MTPLLVSTAQHMKEMYGGPQTCGCDGEIPRLVQVPGSGLGAQLGWPPEVDSPMAPHPHQIVDSFSA